MGNYKKTTTCETACFEEKLPLTCEICFEEKLPVKSSIYKKETKCSKPHRFCQDCVATHILYKIQAKIAVIRCPGVDCNAIISPVECHSLISRNNFVEWCDIMAETWIVGNGHRQAVCPYEGCFEVVIDECKGGGRQECPRCKRVFCFGCGVKWSISHHRVCRSEELVFLNAARQGNWKRCPNCRFFVQRIAGCDRVTCRCGTAFCYRCGVQGSKCACMSIDHCFACILCICLPIWLLIGLMVPLYNVLVRGVAELS